jgi:acyl carrier protein phosphodiesterase
VNFFGHLVLARRLDPGFGFGFGSMWPDFSGILSIKAESSSPSVQSGILFHHQVDAVFHQGAHFVSLQRSAFESLQRRGVPRGPARAVAHIGVELLLDAELAGDTAETQHYRAVLGRAETAAREWFPSLNEVETTRLLQWCQRLGERAERIAPRTSEQLAERLAGILEARPRLALPSANLRAVSEWVEEIWPEIRRVREPWFEALQGQLQERSAASSGDEMPSNSG